MTLPEVDTAELVLRSKESSSDTGSGTIRPAITGNDNDCTQALSAKIEAFAKSLNDTFPVALIPDGLAETLRHDANHRLKLAQTQGIKLEDIYFGEDCLPAWRTLYWDPEEETLHSIIQRRLLYLQLAQDLGDLLHQELRTKSTHRLRRAQAMGIKLEAISIGESLLPEWNAGEDNGQHEDAPVSVSEDALRSPPCVELTSNTLETTAEDTKDLVETVTGSIDTVTLLPTDAEDPALFQDLAPDTFYESDEEDDGPDEIYMSNYVSARPVYDEYGNSNIVHDVEVVGASGQHANVDLEVYMAIDDEDVEDLPEVELAIDKEAFEHHFGDQDAVDIHFPDMELFCFDRVEEYDADEDADGEASQANVLPQQVCTDGEDWDDGDEKNGDCGMDVDESGRSSSGSEYSEEE